MWPMDAPEVNHPGARRGDDPRDAQQAQHALHADPEGQTVGDAAQIGLEEAMLGRIEPVQRDKRADFGLGQAGAE